MTTMKEKITEQLMDVSLRLTEKGLFGRKGDVLSMRVPGTEELVWLQGADAVAESTLLSDAGGEALVHAAVYQKRADAGAVLLSTTDWSEQLSVLQRSVPVLFDEQARHIGRMAEPVAAGETAALLEAVKDGSNVALYGVQCLRIGMTRDRIAFNAELFEKCAMAFVIAVSSGQKLSTVPAWVRYIAGARLRKDQKRAQESYALGRIPQGMNAY